MSAGALATVVLISGRGSNLGALVAARDAGRLDLDLRCVISNAPGAAGLELARLAGARTEVVEPGGFASREAHDAHLAARVAAHEPALVVLAGYMRILGPAFTTRFAGRTINIHPSLLPAYPGLHTHRRALEAGDRVHGASIHFVTDELDGGPVISQVTIDVRPDDTPETLAARLLPCEHRLMVATVELFCRGRVEGRHGSVLLDGVPLARPLRLENDHLA